MPHRRIVRSSDRHQAEKNLVLASEDQRRETGASETDLGVPLDHLQFTARYDVVEAGAELAEVFTIEPEAKVLRRTYETVDPSARHRQAWSVSYIPHALVAGHPDLLNADMEPWPGGTQHQLYTIGIEVARMIDEVSAEMPSTVDMQLWGMEQGVPVLKVRRISIDANGSAVEVSDAEYPADRTELRFTTELATW
jgi:GntR family transcriptional regulator